LRVAVADLYIKGKFALFIIPFRYRDRDRGKLPRCYIRARYFRVISFSFLELFAPMTTSNDNDKFRNTDKINDRRA